MGLAGIEPESFYLSCLRIAKHPTALGFNATLLNIIWNIIPIELNNSDRLTFEVCRIATALSDKAMASSVATWQGTAWRPERPSSDPTPARRSSTVITSLIRSTAPVNHRANHLAINVFLLRRRQAPQRNVRGSVGGLDHQRVETKAQAAAVAHNRRDYRLPENMQAAFAPNRSH